MQLVNAIVAGTPGPSTTSAADVVPTSQLFVLAAQRYDAALEWLGFREPTGDAPAPADAAAAIREVEAGARILHSTFRPDATFAQRQAAAASIDDARTAVLSLTRYANETATLGTDFGRSDLPLPTLLALTAGEDAIVSALASIA